MINQKPILIAAPPRSGTTMIAGLLAKHGVWIGRGRTTNYPGTNPKFVSENQDIKQLFKHQAIQQGYKNWKTPIPKLNGVEKQDIEKLIPNNKQWLVKTSWVLMFCDFWMNNYPDALWVFPFRDSQSILDSMNRHPGMSKRPNTMKRYFIEGLMERQKELWTTVNNAVFVDVKEISKLKSNELLKLFNFVNVRPNWKKVEQWIQPGRMK